MTPGDGQEIGGEFARFALLAEFRGDRLKLFHERVTGMVTGDAGRAVVEDVHLAGSIAASPRTDIDRPIRRDIIKS